MLKKFSRKLLAYLLVAVLLAAMLPVSVLAEGDYDDMVAYQGETVYYDENGVQVTDETKISAGNYAVALEKTIAATENENEYEITLKVDTTVQIIETEKIVGADIVLVIDVSTSMDFTPDKKEPGDSDWSLSNTRWAALKAAATSFINKMLPQGTSNRISIVVYGGSNGQTRQYNHATLCNWTGSASEAIASYSEYEVVCQDYVNRTSDKNKPSLRSAVFGDNSTNYGGTNCQAGFYAAELMLSSVESGKIPYVVYMSDGDANRYISNCSNTTTNHSHNTTCQQFALNGGYCIVENSSGYENRAVQAAQAQAAQVKTNYPDVTLYTIGFGTSATNAVMNKNYNTAVDESYISYNENDLIVIYDYVAEQIELTANPWTVFDPMGTQVTLVDDFADNEYVSLTEDGFKWNLLAEQQADPDKRSFTLTYTITLDINSNTAYWADDAENPTNNRTYLTYQIVKTDAQGNIIATHDAVRADFDVPEVKANLYTITLKHWKDDAGKTGEPANIETFTYGVGYEIDLDSYIKDYPYYTYVERDDLNADGATITTSADTNGRVINYHYKSGYPLTINYLDADDSKVIGTQYRGVYGSGEDYSVESPIIPGYELKNENESIVEGKMPDGQREIDVLYRRAKYTVTYEITSTDNPSYTLPVDNKEYYYNEEVTVADALTAEGWTFSGWDRDSGFQITGNTVISGHWTRNTYLMDVIYVFDSGTEVDAGLEGLGTFYDDEDPYTAANRKIYENVYVNIEPVQVTYGGAYNCTAETVSGYKVSPVSRNGTVSGDTTLIFTLTNNKFTLTVNYWMEDVNNIGYYIIDANSTEISTLLGGAFYSAEEKSFNGYAYSYADKGLTGTMPESDLVINLYYNATPYTASFEYVGDAPIDEPDDHTPIYYGGRVKNPGVSYVGWTFDGWYSNPNCEGEKYNFNTPVTDNVVLYGKWTRNLYNVTYKFANPSLAPNGVTPPVDSNDYTYGLTFAAQGDPDFTNPAGATYTFDGWYTSSDCTGGKYDYNTPVTGNLELWGKWSRTTNQYGYSVEHYLIEGGVSELKLTVPGDRTVDYGYTFSQSEANSMALAGQGLADAMGHAYVTFTKAETTTITDGEGNNIVKCYYTVNSYSLTIYYQYQNGDVAAPTYGPAQVEYGSTYSVTSPTVQNYHVQDQDKLVVSGKMPAQNVVIYVVYAQDPMYTVTVRYRAVGDEDTPIAQDHVIGPMYAGTGYTIGSEHLNQKSIPYYSYDSIVNERYAEGPMGNTNRVITVYFTRNQNTLKVNHIDVSGTQDFSGNNIDETLPQGSVIDVKPLNPIPNGYKLIIASVDEGTVTTSGSNFSGTLIDNVEITYTYDLLTHNRVIINYMIEGTENQVPGAAPYTSDIIRENSPYDVTGEYNRGITGYTRVTETVEQQSGTMGTTDVILKVYYTVNSYPYEVVYINDYTSSEIARYNDHEALAADFGTILNADIVGAAMAVVLEDDANWINYHMPSGYYLNGATYCTINVEGNVVEVHYNYTSSPVSRTYSITINYYREGTTTALANRFSESYSSGYRYDVTELTELEIDSYTRITPVDGALTGTLNGNVVINVYYRPGGGGDIDDPGTDPGTDPGDDPGYVDIEDPEVPMGERPEDPDIEEAALFQDGFEIDDPEVPLGSAPQTGVASASVPLLLTMVASFAGVAVLVFGRKKEDEE